MVAEGVRTAQSVYQLSSRLGVDMPISRQTYRILYEELPPREALYELMARELKPELDDD
jgi:glycerol-3-phosphate dehydrogenase (NAD(P)+)